MWPPAGRRAPCAASCLGTGGDVEPKTGLAGVELVTTRLHAGGKFGGGSYTASGGLHGVGASVVNALAGRLDVQVDRNGAEWAASLRRGVPGEFSGPGPDAPFRPATGLRRGRRGGRTAGPARGRVSPAPAGCGARAPGGVPARAPR